jgi:transglutaminase-like putative cysteine protease
MRSLFFLVCFLLAAAPVRAQEYLYGKVSLSELQEKQHPLDSTAPAAILYKKGKTYFELRGLMWVLVTEVEVRIKIYNSAGYSYGTKEFDYFTWGNRIIYSFIDGCTYNAEGENIVKHQLGPEGMFSQADGNYRAQKKIVLPGIEEGSVIEYKYKIESRYFSNFGDWFFQYEIPANYVAYEVAIPEFFTYRSFLTGKVGVQQTKPRTVYSKTFRENVVFYSAAMVKPLKEEAFTNNIENYLAVLKHELVSADYQEGEFVTHFTTDWKSVVSVIHKDDDFGKQFENTAFLQKPTDDLAIAGTPGEKKLTAVYNHIRERMNWNGMMGYSCFYGIKDAYQNKVGNVADINLALVAMLRRAGINANPVLVSTRSHGLALYPSLHAYNYVVVLAEIEDGKQILLDATSKNATPGILPARALNWVGRMIGADGRTREIDLVPYHVSRESVNIFGTIAADGIVKGRLRSVRTDNLALEMRDFLHAVNEDEYLKSINTSLNLEIFNYKRTNDDTAKPFQEEYEFTSLGSADAVGTKLYINPILFYTKNEAPFTAATREYPVDFIFPFQKKYTISLNLPEGYDVESVPESLTVVMDKGLGQFTYLTSVTGRQVQVVFSYTINQSLIEPEDYNIIKDFYNKMIAKQSEKIVLKKQ